MKQSNETLQESHVPFSHPGYLVVNAHLEIVLAWEGVLQLAMSWEEAVV
jgi:hypothetical protein